MSENSRKMLKNLTGLQRMDPYIDQILFTASRGVVLYNFNFFLNQWSYKDVEGSLFVVKRNAQPRFQFTIMNRRNTENLVEDLLGDFDYELQVPYILYRNAAQEANGICFINPRECEDVANLFTRIIGAYSKVTPKPKVNKRTFEELEAVPTSAVIERPLEPPFTTSSSTDVPEDSSFAKFFGTAMKLGHHASSNSVNSAQPFHNSTRTHLHSRVASSPVLDNLSLHIPLYTSRTPEIPSHDTPEPHNSNNRVTNLIKPLAFFTPSSSASQLMPQTSPSVPGAPLQPPGNAQHNHGIPLLQPFPPPTSPSSFTPGPTSSAYYGTLIRGQVPTFPPPTSPSSFTPGPTSSAYYGTLSRGQVRDALLMLAQDNQFIDVFHQALLKVHQQ